MQPHAEQWGVLYLQCYNTKLDNARRFLAIEGLHASHPLLEIYVAGTLVR